MPILAVYAGYTLNGTSDTGATLTDDVTDAVNELHYVLDPVTTTWGRCARRMGIRHPYNVTYVEIGNEDFFSSTYGTRYPLFYNAIHAAFPSLKIIATSTNTGGSPFDVLDDHFYNSPQWFESNSNYFDNTPRGSYQIFIGEYAANRRLADQRHELGAWRCLLAVGPGAQFRPCDHVVVCAAVGQRQQQSVDAGSDRLQQHDELRLAELLRAGLALAKITEPPWFPTRSAARPVCKHW